MGYRGSRRAEPDAGDGGAQHHVPPGLDVVSVGYGRADRPLGGLGIVGPTRMDFPGNMAAVRAVARYVGHLLAES